MASQSLPFDPLVATASDLQKLLDDGVVTSEGLVNVYLAQIEKHNHHGMKLNAVISTTPRDTLLTIARGLDQERRVRGKRGPLHGIPIILKDSICTPSVGLPTTCGSYALVGATAIRDATVTTRLVQAGAIIIAKANLSEWSNFKQRMMTSGWSAVGGQTQSPYVRGGVLRNATPLGHSTPAGSSSGSAVSVAAGFAPVSVATESDGSIVYPAGRAAVYALKLTVGTVPMDGCQANAQWLTTLGAMAKSPLDLTDTVSVLLRTNDLSRHLTGSWAGIRVGFVDLSEWRHNPIWVEHHEEFFRRQEELVEDAIHKITANGATVIRDVDLIKPAQIVAGTPLPDIRPLSAYQARAGFAHFMSNFEGTTVRTLDDLVRFNLYHAELELPPEYPTQESILAAANPHNKLTPEAFAQYSTTIRSTTAHAVTSLLTQHSLTVIIGPTDSRMAGIAAAAGLPIGNVPMGFAEGLNGRAIGLSVLAGAGNEKDILRVMAAWERSLPGAREAPPLMVGWGQ
ncbi:amidase signature domain-containing protein [Staphylotrichum tortipilum]|uniref:Amidase signature domain-containing protein n=1 Tax=Staphylotrichum tortipilum TaxID=2831512 RepID=A0AAN6RPW8_9PEZI|nr:amidase signature domain-containing protein [Staphylotrichum longicolle]